MRILFAFTGGRGHVEPLVPLAEAARAAGHTVAFGGRGSILPAVEALVFEAFATEPGTKPPERLPLQPVDLERERRDFRDGFVLRSRERIPGVVELCREWRPDVVVGEETHYAALAAAELLGLPCASVVVLAAATLATPDLVAEPLRQVREEAGLPPDPDTSMVSRQLVLAPLPPSFRDPAQPLPAATVHYRPFDEAPPPYEGLPRVYFTLGTVFTSSRAISSRASSPGSPSWRSTWARPSELLATSSVVVSHGGSGSLLGALAHGLPQVLIPMGADQPFNAARAAQLGVARVLDPVAATAEDVRDAVAAVLEQPSYREAAGQLQAEFVALPGPAHAVSLLERLR